VAVAPLGWLRDTGALYARAFERGARLALRNWPVGLVAVACGRLVDLVALLVAPLGLAGGLLAYLAFVAVASLGLTLVAEVIRAGRVRLQDVPAGLTAYLSDLLSVFFLFWLLSLVASLVLAPFPFLRIVFGLATLVFLNAVPELIYLGRHPAGELLVESYRFIGQNWIEWFPANIVLGMCVLAARSLPAGPYDLIAETATGLVLYFAMIVRGLLFLELSSSSRRAREFRRRAAL
jgi:hypothetical protein